MTTFSIIVPVYNGESYIDETIKSVIKYSSNQEREIIVINDGSTDNTLQILQMYQFEIKIISQANAGEANAVNQGLMSAQGRFSLVVSADDPLISEDLFSEALEVLDADDECVAVYPDWQIIGSRNEVISIKHCPDYSFEELLGEFHCLPGPGTIFRTEDARAIDGRSTEYKYVSDYDFWLRLAVRGKFTHLPKVLAQWRSHDESTSIAQRGVSMALERIKVIDDFLEKYPQPENLARQARSCSIYNAAILAFYNSDVPGRRWMIDAIKINRGWIKSSKIHIVGYLLLLPFSRFLYKNLVSSGLIRQRTRR